MSQQRRKAGRELGGVLPAILPKTIFADPETLPRLALSPFARIKHRPLKGYKTLCRATISLNTVLQKDMVAQDLKLLTKTGKDMAVISVKQIVSSPAAVPENEEDPDTDDSLSDHVVRACRQVEGF